MQPMQRKRNCERCVNKTESHLFLLPILHSK